MGVSHIERVLPDKFSYGSSGGPGFDVGIIRSDSGAESRRLRGSGLHTYELNLGPLSWDDLYEMREFFNGVRGALIGFRLFDHHDNTTAANGVDAPTHLDQLLGTSDGSGQTFQMLKRYDAGGSVAPYTRTLTKLVADSTRLSVGGVELFGAAWSVDVNTGVVTLASGAAGVVRAGCRFHVPVRFADDAGRRLAVALEGEDTASAGSIGLVEVPDQTAFSEPLYGGGFAVLDANAGASSTWDRHNGRLQVLANHSTFSIRGATVADYGGPVATFVALTDSTVLRDVGRAVDLVTLDADDVVDLYGLPASDGQPGWVVL